jgi:hypothetical protein
MSEEGQQHPQEPAEGGEGDAQAPRAERPGEVEESVGNLTDAPAGLEHPAEPTDPAKRPSRRGMPSDKGVTARGPVRREAGRVHLESTGPCSVLKGERRRGYSVSEQEDQDAQPGRERPFFGYDNFRGGYGGPRSVRLPWGRTISL